MARNEQLEDKIREALIEIPNVEEKQMFGGTAFMVAEKLCIAAGDDELMFRIDPALHEEAVQQSCREMLRNGKAIKGYVYVHEENLKTDKQLNYWIGLALEYNRRAKPAIKKAKR